MSLNLYAVAVLLGLLCFVCPIVLYFTIKNKKALKIVTVCLLIIYLVVLGIGVFSNVWIEGANLNVDFTPKGKWFNASSFIYYNFSLINVCVNLFMFLPIGMALFILFDNHKFWWTAGLSLLISLLIEFGQFALPVVRTVELTDLVYNTLSGVLGYLIFFVLSLIEKSCRKKKNVEK